VQVGGCDLTHQPQDREQVQVQAHGRHGGLDTDENLRKKTDDAAQAGMDQLRPTMHPPYGGLQRNGVGVLRWAKLVRRRLAAEVFALRHNVLQLGQRAAEARGQAVGQQAE
jgi:hypothetical protein